MSIKAGPRPLSGVRRAASQERGRDPPTSWRPELSSSSVRLRLSADAQRILSGQEVSSHEPPPLTYARSGVLTRPGEDGRAYQSFTHAARAPPSHRARPAPEPALTLLPGGRAGEDTS